MAVTQPDGYWKFDESSGNAADSTVNGNALTNNGTSAYAAGALNNAVELNATTKFMDVADNAVFHPTSALSISYWCYLNALPGGGEWAFASSADTAGTNRNWVLEMGVYPDGLYFITSKDGTLNAGSYDEYDSAASILPAIGAWHHYAFAYDVAGGTVTTYIDNVTKTMTRRAAQNVTALSTVASKFGIGVAYGTGRTGNWRFDEYGYWKNYKLTAAEVNTLYNGGTPPTYASLFGSATPKSNNLLLMGVG